MDRQRSPRARVGATALGSLLFIACTSGTTGQSPLGSPTRGATVSVSSSTGVASANTMSTPRAAHTATTLLDGRVLIAGGFGVSEGDEVSAELYDPESERFEQTGAMSVWRQSHSATLLPDGQVLIVGGYDPAGRRLATAEIYDPTTGRFTQSGSMTGPRADHTATLLDDGRVLIAGGTGPGFSFLSSAELYDPVSGTFTPTGAMSVRRESATATLLDDGRVLIAGGHAGRHESIEIYASAETYDPATGRFALVGDMTIPRHKHDAVLLADGRVLVVGGSDASDDLGLYDSAELFDPANDTFSVIKSRLHEARYKMRGTSTLLADGRALVCCGAPRAELFDPTSEQFVELPGALGAGPLFAAAAPLGPDELLVTGGYSLSGPASADAWLIHA